MIEQLIIRLIESKAGLQAEWALRRDGWNLGSSSTPIPLTQLTRALPTATKVARETVVLLPAAWVMLSSVHVPEKQRSHLQQVLPFLLEEQLAEEVAQLHIVTLGVAAAGQPQPVAVIRAALLQTTLSALHQAGITPQYMIPETLSLPCREGEWHMLWSDDTVWTRHGQYGGIATDIATFPAMASLLLQTEIPPKAIVCILSTTANNALVEHAMVPIQQQVPQVPMRGEQSPKTAFEYMCDSYNRAEGLTLLQGAFANVSSAYGKGAPWRRLARIAGLWLVAYTVLTLGQTFYFSMQARHARAEITAQYRILFPEDKKIIDPIRQMKARLGERNGPSGSGFLSQLSAIARVWETAGGVEIQSLTYRATGDPVLFSLTSKSLETMNAFVQQLTAAGLNATLTSVTTNESIVAGQLTVGEPRE